MKEGFTFNKVSLMFLRKVIFKNFVGGGGGNRKEPKFLSKIFVAGGAQKRARSEALLCMITSLANYYYLVMLFRPAGWWR